ncbi:sensor histidine kinase ResE [Collibacillus ludicampi]|uniref:histidine kinase n=1 Tax=Collibacillus ludicampi TaxID=2771369 RepID=A0AAV4LK94_9BACL|nr:ATP-binding protein [Collibacillus ludicampi]GIM48262.1 sensor histidine kinase ResE [Collibacillus ludicampi]
MIRNSVVAKLWLTIIGLVVIVLTLLSVFLEQLFDSYFYKTHADELVKKADYIHQLILNEPDRDLAMRVANLLAAESNSHILITGPLDVETKDVLKNLPKEEQDQLKNGNPVVERDLNVRTKLRTDTENIWVIFPLTVNDTFHGLLLMNQPITVTQDAIVKIRDLILFAAGLGIVLATGLAFVVSKNLSRPLIQMNRVAERMAEGDFHGKVNVVTQDEVGQLGMTLNALAYKLEDTINHLSKEKEQLAGILTSITSGVVSADLNGHVILANPPAKRWLRSLWIQGTGRADEQRLPQELWELEQLVLQKRQVHEVEQVWKGRSIAITMTPLYEPGEEIVRGVVAVFRDITEEKTLDRLRKDFVANVSHELRTPLAMMQGYSEALIDDFGDDPEQRRELAQIILDETHRMRRLVNDLLDLAQLESGQFQMNTSLVDMRSVLKKVGRKFVALAHDNGVELRVSIAEDGSYQVCADADRLEQVFINLVDNALRYTPRGGTVTLEMMQEGNFIRTTVRDTGTGIPPEDLPFIFERFYKADKARTRSKGGTGLGLSIARNIVLRHQGDIVVKSEIGVGTSFIVLLPIAKDTGENGDT